MTKRDFKSQCLYSQPLYYVEETNYTTYDLKKYRFYSFIFSQKQRVYHFKEAYYHAQWYEPYNYFECLFHTYIY